MCNQCRQTFFWKNKGTKHHQQLKIFHQWIYNRKTLKDLTHKYQYFLDKLRRLFKIFLNKPLIIDGTYFKSNFCLLKYFDNDCKDLVWQKIVVKESYQDFFNDLMLIKQQGVEVESITSDGHKGLLKAVRVVFSHTLHQRCVIHIQRMSLTYLFHYLDNSLIPKSTNGLETKFSFLKNDLKIHRGLSKKSRENFVLWYNYFKYKNH